MAFIIKNPGLLTTFQDQGRYGHQSTGISPSGVLDFKSAVLANQLVGNEDDEVVLEMTISGLTFDVTKDTVIALVGAELEVRVNGELYPIGRSISLAKNDVVEMGQMTKGLRTYLAVTGGFTLDKELGSYSTHTRTTMGGIEGRALKAGDILYYNGQKNRNLLYSVSRPFDADNNLIRIIPGPNYDDLTNESKEDLVTKTYKISRDNDRMGIRLEGQALKTSDGVHDILSEPTQLGNIQVPKNGLPIILLNDRQTTGGYKRMASVIKVDLPKLVQMKPNTPIQFEMIGLEEAILLYQDEMKKLQDKEYLKIDTNYQYYRRVQADRISKLLLR